MNSKMTYYLENSHNETTRQSTLRLHEINVHVEQKKENELLDKIRPAVFVFGIVIVVFY